MLEQKVDQSKPVAGEFNVVGQVRVVFGQLFAHEGILCNRQRIQANVLENLGRKVVGQEVGGNLLVAHGFPEEGVVDVVYGKI